MERKGFVVIYLNIGDHSQLSLDEYIELMKRHNAAVIEVLKGEGYESMFVPCFNEACRVDKIDFQNNGKEE